MEHHLMSEITDEHASSRYRYLTTDEAASFLRLSPRTLEKRRVTGGGPRFRKLCGRVVYAIHDLEAWVDARIFRDTSDPAYLELNHPRRPRR